MGKDSWQIGTSVFSYYNRYLEFIRENKNFKDNIFKIEKNNKNYKIMFNELFFDEGSKAKIASFIKVLLSLGFIKEIGLNLEYENNVEDDDLLNLKYKNELNSLDEKEIFQSIWRNIRNWFNLNEITDFYKKTKVLHKKYKIEDKFYNSLIWTIFNKKNNREIDKKYNDYDKISDILKEYYDHEFMDDIFKNFLNKKNILDEVTNVYENLSKGNLDLVKKKFWEKNNNDSRNTSDPSDDLHSHIETFGDFILTETSCPYYVPIYQREYTWKEKNINILLLDCNEIEKFHYLGNIILYYQNRSQSKSIVDGQQRITSLILILIAIQDYSLIKGWDVDKDVFNLFDKSYEKPKILDKFQFIQNSKESNDLKNIVLKKFSEINDDSKIKTNYIESLCWLKNNIKNSNDCENLWKNILNKINLNIVDINTNDQYKLFERLNAYGEPLSEYDLFKNFIIYHFSKNNKFSNMNDELLNNEFQTKIINNLKTKGDKKDYNEKFKNFVFSFLKLNEIHIENIDSNLFISLKEFIEKWIEDKKIDNLSDFLNEFEKYVKFYTDIKEYNCFSKSGNPYYDISDFLFVLNGRDVYIPLIQKIIINFSNDFQSLSEKEVKKIREYLKVLEIHDIRLKVSNYKGQSLSQNIFKAIKEIKNVNSPKELFNILVSDEENSIKDIDCFHNHIINDDIKNDLAIKLIFRIENFLYMESWDKNKNTNWLCFFEKKPSREHFIPRNFDKSDDWKDIVKNMEEKDLNDINRNMDKIGNTLPLSIDINSSIKDKNIKNKLIYIQGKGTYAKHLYLVNGFQYENIEMKKINYDFNSKNIIERTKCLADLLKIIYDTNNIKDNI